MRHVGAVILGRLVPHRASIVSLIVILALLSVLQFAAYVIYYYPGADSPSALATAIRGKGKTAWSLQFLPRINKDLEEEERFANKHKSAVLVSLHKFDPYVWFRLEELAGDLPKSLYDVIVFCDGNATPLPDKGTVKRVNSMGFEYRLHDRKRIQRAYSASNYKVFTAPYF